MKGKYIYGIINGGADVSFSARGLFNKRPYLIEYNNISAVVTDAPIRTYEADQKGLLAHNRVLDEIMKGRSVLPLSFGTIARSEDEVKSLLRSAYTVLLNILAKIRDKAEFTMEIIVTDEKPILNEILQKNKEIQDLRNRLISQGEDVRLQDKLLIGKMIAVEVNRYKLDLVKDIIATLRPYYFQTKALVRKDILANLAFLVTRNKIVDFESTIYKLGEKYGDRLKFKYAGPLAPYSFVEIKLLLINFHTVDNARRQLGLGEEATPGDIKDAYRKLAIAYHPDKNPGDKLKEEEFKKLASSYRLLCEYSRRYPRSRYIFTPDKIDEFSVLMEEE